LPDFADPHHVACLNSGHQRGLYRLFRKLRAAPAAIACARGFADYLRISHSLSAGFIQLENAQRAVAFTKRGERDPF
jgi:hypothetical protein